MNWLLILRVLSIIAAIEGLCMLPSLAISLFYGEGDWLALLASALICLAVGGCLYCLKPREKNLRPREGLLIVAFAWILLSALGALPFILSGMIPRIENALFESVSGFTTTGASILTDYEGLPHGVTFWRSFTHWIGGMGVLVLTLALLPQISGNTAHLVKAESPGPTLSKIKPKMGDSAKFLYLIYAMLTLVEFIALWIAGIPVYEAAIYAFGTAGTGGFANTASGIGGYNNPAAEIIVTIFMVIFGINFAMYYRVMTGHGKDILKNEETRWFLGLFLTMVIILTIILIPHYGSLGQALRYAGFQTASIMSTTGFATADYTIWPIATRNIIFFLMFLGACAGSTAGGMKTIRLVILSKMSIRSIRQTFQPRKAKTVTVDGKEVDASVLTQTAAFFFIYLILVLLGSILLSFGGKFDMETNLSAALTCVSNVGPGFGAVGPAGNFAGYGVFEKLLMCFLMLCGRLEIFPVLILFHPAMWRRQ